MLIFSFKEEYLKNYKYILFFFLSTQLHKKILGCLNSILGQIWTNPNIGLKINVI